MRHLLILWLTSTISFASNADSRYLNDFDTYLATPFKEDRQDPLWKKAYQCRVIPGRSVCMSEDEYRILMVDQARVRRLEKMIDEKSPEGFSTLSLVVIAFSGVVSGVLLAGLAR